MSSTMRPATAQTEIVDEAAAPVALWEATSDLDARVGLLLGSGGDERIWPDPVTRRNRYGTAARPAASELHFGSSTSSTVSPRGFAASRAALASLLGEAGPRTSIEAWLETIRADLWARFAGPGAEVVLAASGTDAELITVALAVALSRRPLTNIVIAPEETGSGVQKAAVGRHFLPSAALETAVDVGHCVPGLDGADVVMVPVALRSADGLVRPAADVDRDVAIAVEDALRRQRDVLLHVLDVSKTGLSGPSRACVNALTTLAPDRIRVVVDACQLRSPPDVVRSDLAAGFMVQISGSKFAGGPPFSGALLLPEAIAARLEALEALAPGLAAFSALNDWPERFRSGLAAFATTSSNFGLGLRWTAAGAELARLARVPVETQARIIAGFEAEVLARADALGCVHRIDDEAQRAPFARSIVPLMVLDGEGRPAPVALAERLHRTLRDGSLGCVAHVGQSVRLANAAALRVCASAAHVADAGELIAAGGSLSDALAPLGRELDVLFEAWAEGSRRLVREAGR
jgi:hypothetical protein